MRVERLAEEYAIDVEWKPFELHPETPPEGRPARAPSGAFERVRESAQRSGIEMRRPERSANSRMALEASEWVRAVAPEAFDRFHRAVFEAYFGAGLNIGDPDVLVTIAEHLSLDGAALREVLASRAYAPAVDEGIQWAADRGLTSTPFFIFVADRLYGVPGAQEYEVFEQVMERLAVPRRPPAAR